MISQKIIGGYVEIAEQTRLFTFFDDILTFPLLLNSKRLSESLCKM